MALCIYLYKPHKKYYACILFLAQKMPTLICRNTKIVTQIILQIVVSEGVYSFHNQINRVYHGRFI